MKPFIEILRSLTDQTRLRIVRLLADAKTEICVCEFVDSLEADRILKIKDGSIVPA